MIEIILPKENRIEVCFIDGLKSVILYCLNMVQCFVLASYWIKPDISRDLLHLCSCSVSDIISVVAALRLLPGHFFSFLFLDHFCSLVSVALSSTSGGNFNMCVKDPSEDQFLFLLSSHDLVLHASRPWLPTMTLIASQSVTADPAGPNSSFSD